MGKSDITLPDLYKAYEEWIGTPVTSLKLRHDEANDVVPTEMDILFFQPPEEDNLAEEELFTFVATAGMSTRVMQGPCPHAELILRVDKRQDINELKALGRSLGELAIIPFRENTYYAPNLVVCNVSLPLFEYMNCVLITNWGVQSPEYLPTIQPHIQLLSIKPIYASEADVIEKIGDIEASRRFTIQGINWNDPKRPPAHLEELPSVSRSKKRKKKK